MATVKVVKKNGEPVAASVSVSRGGSRMGPRNGTGPRARAGLCPRVSASDQVALACRRR